MERSAPPPPGRPHSRRAPALHPRQAGDGAAEGRRAGKQLRGAGGARAPSAGPPGAAMEGCQRQQRGGEPEAGEPRLGGTLPRGGGGGSEAAAGREPGGASPAARGRGALPGRSTALRGSRCPAGGGPSAALWVCTPGEREAFLAGTGAGAGALAAPRDLCPPRST